MSILIHAGSIAADPWCGLSLSVALQQRHTERQKKAADFGTQRCAGRDHRLEPAAKAPAQFAAHGPVEEPIEQPFAKTNRLRESALASNRQRQVERQSPDGASARDFAADAAMQRFVEPGHPCYNCRARFEHVTGERLGAIGKEDLRTE